MYILPFSSVCNIWSFHFFNAFIMIQSFFFQIKQNILGQSVFRSTRRPSNSFFLSLLYIHNIIQTLVLKFPSDLILFLSCSFLFLSLLCCFRTPASLRLLVSAIPPLLVAFPLDAAFESPARPLRSWASSPQTRGSLNSIGLHSYRQWMESPLQHKTEGTEEREREQDRSAAPFFSKKWHTSCASRCAFVWYAGGERAGPAWSACPRSAWTGGASWRLDSEHTWGEGAYEKGSFVCFKKGRKIWKWENELIKILIGD